MAGDFEVNALEVNGAANIDGGATIGDAAVITSTGNTPLQVRRDVATENANNIIDLQMKDDAGNYHSYGRVITKIADPANGVEDGRILVQISIAGTMTTILTIDETGIALANLPTSTPGDTGRVWSDSGTLKIT